MTENDDQLIKSFMQAHKREIVDNGFSRRVIHRLPQRAQWLSNILSILCTIACCILFYVFHGFEVLLHSIVEIINAQSWQLFTQTSFQSLAIATIVLIIVGVQRACSIK